MKNLLILITTLLLSTGVVAQENIEEARDQGPGQTVTVSGIVTNGPELGPIRYFQDETAGLAAYGSSLGELQRGDSVTISGALKDFEGLLELDPVTTFTRHASGKPLPEPKVLTAGQIGEAYESQLVRINNVSFVNSSGTFEAETNYTLSDGENTFEIRIDREAEAIKEEKIPSGTIDLVAICSQYNKYNPPGYQLFPRDMNDIILKGAINILSPVTVQNITKNGFTLQWETDAEATPEAFYGTTPEPGGWTQKVTGTVTPSNGNYLQELNFSGLEPGEVVFSRIYSYLSADTAFAPVAAYATESNSSGNIRAYFNSNVDASYATQTVAQNIGPYMDDTLVAVLDRATESIDMAIYNISSISGASIPEALNRARRRGVDVRVITCGSTSHSGVYDLDAAIPVLERPRENDRSGIMHNKFAVIDANTSNPDKPLVWSGSTNLTYNQIHSDANNILFIQDQALARAYQIEFEEMWGSEGLQPDEARSRFGENKKDNTPHEFIIGGQRVECYFSPSDQTNQKLIHALSSADKNMNVATMLITRTDIAEAIRNAREGGVDVHVLTNKADDNSGSVNTILSSALGSSHYVFDDAASGTMHNKYAVIDNDSPGLDPLVLTGSHNWSNSANETNDENTLIIHSEDIANQYFQNFAARFKINNGVLATGTNFQKRPVTTTYPNPVSGRLFLHSPHTIATVELFSSSGMRLLQIEPVDSRQGEIDMHPRRPGLYLLRITLQNGLSETVRIIKK